MFLLTSAMDFPITMSLTVVPSSSFGLTWDMRALMSCLVVWNAVVYWGAVWSYWREGREKEGNWEKKVRGRGERVREGWRERAFQKSLCANRKGSIPHSDDQGLSTAKHNSYHMLSPRGLHPSTSHTIPPHLLTMQAEPQCIVQCWCKQKRPLYSAPSKESTFRFVTPQLSSQNNLGSPFL